MRRICRVGLLWWNRSGRQGLGQVRDGRFCLTHRHFPISPFAKYGQMYNIRELAVPSASGGMPLTGTTPVRIQLSTRTTPARLDPFTYSSPTTVAHLAHKVFSALVHKRFIDLPVTRFRSSTINRTFLALKLRDRSARDFDNESLLPFCPLFLVARLCDMLDDPMSLSTGAGRKRPAKQARGARAVADRTPPVGAGSKPSAKRSHRVYVIADPNEEEAPDASTSSPPPPLQGTSFHLPDGASRERPAKPPRRFYVIANPNEEHPDVSTPSFPPPPFQDTSLQFPGKPRPSPIYVDNRRQMYQPRFNPSDRTLSSPSTPTSSPAIESIPLSSTPGQKTVPSIDPAQGTDRGSSQNPLISRTDNFVKKILAPFSHVRGKSGGNNVPPTTGSVRSLFSLSTRYV